MHKNLVKFGHVAFKLRKRTDRQQTDIMPTHYDTSHPSRGGGEVASVKLCDASVTMTAVRRITCHVTTRTHLFSIS